MQLPRTTRLLLQHVVLVLLLGGVLAALAGRQRAPRGLALRLRVNVPVSARAALQRQLRRIAHAAAQHEIHDCCAARARGVPRLRASVDAPRCGPWARRAPPPPSRYPQARPAARAGPRRALRSRTSRAQREQARDERGVWFRKRRSGWVKRVSAVERRADDHRAAPRLAAWFARAQLRSCVHARGSARRRGGCALRRAPRAVPRPPHRARGWR
jgi:hypothetical protein